MSQEIIEAPKSVEGEVLTDKLPDTENEKLWAMLADCDDSFEVILDVAQRIDHGMTDCRPNAPNREIVRFATEALAMLRRKAEALSPVIEDRGSDALQIEGPTYGEGEVYEGD